MGNKRSKEAAAYRKLYNTAVWQKTRLAQLYAEPLCRFCEQMGRTTAANVADHVVPHRGDEYLFYYGELQSLCEPCHAITKQRLETFGYDSIAGADGYPIDPNHPANKT